MSSEDYKKANYRRLTARLRVKADADLIEWMDRVNEDGIQTSALVSVALNEFMERHEFDDADYLREYLSRKLK